MMTARFKVIQAGPMVTFQDVGRSGFLRFGVPASGPMDHTAYTTANLALGNSASATAIEVSMGGLVLECLSGTTSIAVTGGDFRVDCGANKTASGTVLSVSAGEKISIRPGASGSWCYLAFAGRAQVNQWLDKTATHALSNLGGGQLKAGFEFEVEDSRVAEDRHGAIPPLQAAVAIREVRVVLGPQEQHFTSDAIETLLSAEFSLTAAYDRMGVRLDGPVLNQEGSLSIPSEPLLKGSIQVSGDGVPTVLLADYQTTGGYPKIATLISADFDQFVQLRAGEKVRFVAVKAEQAIALARSRAEKLSVYFDSVATSKGTLSERLMGQNLISGVLDGLQED